MKPADPLKIFSEPIALPTAKITLQKIYHKSGLFGKRKRNETTPAMCEPTLLTRTPTGCTHAKRAPPKMASIFIGLPPPEVMTKFNRKSGLER